MASCRSAPVRSAPTRLASVRSAPERSAPQGFPLAYEVISGNTSDKTTLADFLKKIEAQYGRSDRVWIMDRGIPTEETLETMRTGQADARSSIALRRGSRRTSSSPSSPTACTSP